jgi:hypothetical protein
LSVSGHEGVSRGRGLSDKEAVDRVAVQGRQGGYLGRMDLTWATFLGFWFGWAFDLGVCACLGLVGGTNVGS